MKHNEGTMRDVKRDPSYRAVVGLNYVPDGEVEPIRVEPDETLPRRPGDATLEAWLDQGYVVEEED